MRSTAADLIEAEPRSSGRVPGSLGSALVFAAAWVAYFGMLQWSVVRFRLPILLTLTAVAVLLGVWVGKPWRVELSRPATAAALGLSAATPWFIPLFSYLRGSWLLAAKITVTVVAVGCAVLLLLRAPRAVTGRRDHAPARTTWGASPAYWLAVVGHVVLAVIAIRGDKAPKIDVWVTLQQAADGMLRGANMYQMRWVGSPGIQDAFTYLPWTAVLLAPGRWLFGDVRWALLACSVLLLLGLRALGGGTTARVAMAAALLVTVPGAITQVDQAWTEPLLAACLVWWVVLVRRGQAWWAIVPLALACASKQHLALLLPVLMLWQPFGARRAVATGALTGVLIAPWFIASPADFVHDTITLLVGFHPIRFANTWYLYYFNTHHVALPFWITGLVVLGALGTAMWQVHRRQPGAAELLRWLALLLLVANLVNKQAFYNQFWLSAALVLMSLTVPDRSPTEPDVARPEVETQPTRQGARG
jgi:hypothetical protein